MKTINDVMMSTAHNFASRSSAQRKKVGAVLSNKGRIVACGYNGTIPGADNCCEVQVSCDNCKGLKCEKCNFSGYQLVTSEFVLHAEQNVLTFCNREGLKTDGCTLYVTMAPCKTCSKLIVSAGIKEVFYDEAYRDLDGVHFLKDLGIKVEQIQGK